LRARVVDAVLVCVIMTAAFLAPSPYTVLDFQQFAADFASDAQHLTGGHAVNLGRGWVYHASTTLRYGLGLPLLIAGVAGMLLLVLRNWKTGLLVALFPVAYYAVLGSGYTVFTRHMVPVVPFLCLTAGYFLAESARWIAQHQAKAPHWRPVLTAIGVVAALWPSARSVIAFDTLIARSDSRVLARRWIERRIPRGATIAYVGPEGGHLYEREEANIPFPTVEFSPDAARPDIVVVQSSPVTEREDIRAIEPILRAEYVLAYSRSVAVPDPRNVYDLQDEFYLPFAGFHVERAGPNLDLYVRRDECARVQRCTLKPWHTKTTPSASN